MVTIRRIILFLFFLTAIAFVLYSGITRYLFFADDIVRSMEEIKISAEQVLFISIVLSVVLLIVLITIFLMSRNIYRELDRINEPVRFGDYSPEMNLKRLGVLGEKINKLYRNLNKVNEGRSLKISSLNSLLSFLMNNISIPMVVATIGGSIVYVSRAYCEKNKVEKKSILEKDIQNYIDETRFADIVNTFEEDRIPIKSDDGKILFFPVYSMHNTLTEIVCMWDHAEVLIDERPEPDTKSTKGRSIKGFIRGKIGRKRS
jgi:hypothetical protein